MIPSALPYLIAIAWLVIGFGWAAHRAEIHPDGFSARLLDALDLFDLFG